MNDALKLLAIVAGIVVVARMAKDRKACVSLGPLTACTYRR